MPDENSKVPQDWFEKGRFDLEAATILHEHGGNSGIIVMHVQQAIEKYLKGFLIANGWELKRTHDLVELLDHACDYEQNLDTYRSFFQELTPFYFTARYPIPSSDINGSTVGRVLIHAQEFIDSIEHALEHEKSKNENESS